MASGPDLRSSHRSPTDENTASLPVKEGRKNVLMKAIQGRLQNKYPTTFLWDFYHEKSSTSADDGERLTLYNDSPIDNWMVFMQYYNNFPFANLRMKDAAHFFKHTVKPIWEDARNQHGGAWHFKVPEKSLSKVEGTDNAEPLAFQFFQQVLLAVVGDELQDLLKANDDICGVSISKRWQAHIIMIWTRRGDETQTIENIREHVINQAPEVLRPMLRMEKNCYYKKHREHDGFDDSLAKRLTLEYESRKLANENMSPS